MTVLNIGGQRVTVDDGFEKLTPEQQNATVEEITKSIGSQSITAASTPSTNAPTGKHLSYEEGVKLLNQEDANNQMSGATGQALAASSSFINGIPVVGPLIQAGVQDAAYGARAALTGEPYQDVANRGAQMTQASQAQHPITSGVSQVAGGVAGTIPIVAAAPAAFGAGEGSLPIRALYSGLTSAGIGTADSAVRSGGDPVSSLVGGAVGGVLGAAGPAVGELAGNIYRSVAENAAQNAAAQAAGVSRPAVGVVARALAADNSIGDAAGNIAAAGPRGMLADAGPSTLSTLDTAIARGGPGAGQASQRIVDRATGATGDINQALDTALGPAQGMVRPLDEIRNAARPGLSTAYADAYAQPIDYSSPQGQTLQNIVETRVPGPVIARANNLMRVNGEQSAQIHANIADDGTVTYQQLPDVRQLDYITRALNDVSRAGDGQGALGGNTAEGRAYGNLSQTIRGILGSDDVVPQYRNALNTAAEPIQQREAMQFGQTMLNPNVSRDEVEGFVAGLTDPQLTALRGGVRAKIAETLANVKRAAADPNIDARQGVAAVKDLSSDAAREKLTTILGAGPANNFFDAVDQAARSFELRAGVTANSRTYARQAATRAVEDMTAPSALEVAAGGKPLEAGRTLLQRLLGVGPEAQLGRQDTAWGDIAGLLTHPAAQGNATFLQAMQGAANRLPIIDQNAAAIARSGGLIGGALALPASAQATRNLRR